jgi:type IV pilus assembly protein PilA
MQDIINRLRAKKQDEGFTLIELLVVVVIIGVLVAIAVPVYLNYRQGAADKSAQSDVRGAISAIEQFYTNNSNTYPVGPLDADNSTGTEATLTLPAVGTGTPGVITLSDATRLGYNYVSATSSYFICATNTGGSGKWYKYDSTAGGSVKASTVATPSLTAC